MAYNDYIERHKARHLRACQMKQLSILEEIDRICVKHHIDYWLESGTLLGAIRHGGFIPWDDDIDVGMLEEDLERFKQVAPSELPHSMMLQSPETVPESKEPIVKVRDNNSFYVEPGDDFSADYPKGLFVDIFPFVPYPTVSRQFCKRFGRMYVRSRAILHKPHRYSLRSVAEFFWFGGQLVFSRIAWWLASLFRGHDKYLSFVLKYNGYGVMHRRECVFPLGTVTFEGKSFPAPCDSDEYLRDLYHDYMQVPPPNQRHIHSVFMLSQLEEEEDATDLPNQ
ncbi:MAG: LicD family protein [Prevotella sp.]|nr:LicD family protein [Prevotella sp.]